MGGSVSCQECWTAYGYHFHQMDSHKKDAEGHRYPTSMLKQLSAKLLMVGTIIVICGLLGTWLLFIFYLKINWVTHIYSSISSGFLAYEELEYGMIARMTLGTGFAFWTISGAVYVFKNFMCDSCFWGLFRVKDWQQLAFCGLLLCVTVPPW